MTSDHVWAAPQSIPRETVFSGIEADLFALLSGRGQGANALPLLSLHAFGEPCVDLGRLGLADAKSAA